ncbi:hypothetical protein PCH_Pc22g20430 [Penicillium rubens Wisconsin 54-1255]|uniref:Uncharacterized protein n=1 Tax=Penicillium rubens (strain ATCC 28089 / DSM 1075 / NRRL 1951 / Wisconsin 54-1255) TaxID=500485 RepID=B6HQU6_PENRW|nr:hypothetical protein PCH_Pc22g20430 [Penicillium rubens Wisconsin 54-1255]
MSPEEKRRKECRVHAVYRECLLSVVYCVHEAPRGLPEAASMVRCRYGMVQLLGGTVQILREIKYPSGKITDHISLPPLSSLSSLTRFRNVEPGAERHPNCGIVRGLRNERKRNNFSLRSPGGLDTGDTKIVAPLLHSTVSHSSGQDFDVEGGHGSSNLSSQKYSVGPLAGCRTIYGVVALDSASDEAM